VRVQLRTVQLQERVTLDISEWDHLEMGQENSVRNAPLSHSLHELRIAAVAQNPDVAKTVGM